VNPDPPPRRAAIALVAPDGMPIGRLPEVPVPTRWWPDVQAIVDAVRDAYGIEVVVLRMLDSELPRPHGGGVTYLAETALPIARSPLAAEALLPFDVTLDDQPLRLRWALPGGPDRDVAWAEDVLAARGIERDGPAEQMRSWNLSSIWRLPLAGGRSAWLKVVPPFFAHEGDMLRRLQSNAVPRLLGHDGDRVLLADVEGDDQYDAAEPELLEMVPMLVDLQAAWIGRVDDLLAIGLPDWRAIGLTARIVDVVGRRSADVSAQDRGTLDRFVERLPARFAAIEACGIPDTLVHGDYHPGNVRGVPGRLVMLDWGDTGVGHPLLDLPAFLEAVPPSTVDRIRTFWLERWLAAVPGCDARRAAELLAPVAAARQAMIYQTFVDNIEPVERRHHDADVIDWLGRAAALARAG
jgi:hypothetical protein